MNYNILSLAIFFTSFLGLGGIVAKKIPVLVNLPEEREEVEAPESPSVKDKLKEASPLKNFSSKLFLEKILKKIRIISLKTDNKMFDWLQRLKEDNQIKKIRDDEEYWDKVKDGTQK
ncbi:MAG: hypothetical protein GF370_04170 [Candidatus Nealsonbacteria bacterium]|nr:hypothetical protein [Candidatus Nealsonbacteria bacterium]